jgi:hypothetical protein
MAESRSDIKSKLHTTVCSDAGTNRRDSWVDASSSSLFNALRLLRLSPYLERLDELDCNGFRSRDPQRALVEAV